MAESEVGDEETSLSDLTRQKQELELLRDVAGLRAEISGFSIPWWRRSSSVTGLAAIVSATVTAVTAVNGHYQTQRELALKEAQQRHDAMLASQRLNEEVRSKYLDRMKDEAERQRTLRFLAATSPDEGVRVWARSEKALVDTEIAKLTERIQSLSDKQEAATRALNDALSRNGVGAAAAAQRIRALSAEKARLESRINSTSGQSLTAASTTMLYEAGRYVECADAFGRSPPSSPGERVLYATCLLGIDRKQEARAQMQIAVDADPEHEPDSLMYPAVARELFLQLRNERASRSK